MKKMIKSSVDWSYYDNPKFDEIDKKYLPSTGEGDNMMAQICTAVNKLVYKWYNDGDVYDNTGWLDGWENDLSSYANWLYKNVDVNDVKPCLESVFECRNESDYEDLLQYLTDMLLNDMVAEKYKDKPKTGSVYNCEGPFQFVENYDEEDDWEDDEYDEQEW